MVQLASILAWGASGRPFESGCSDDFKKAVISIKLTFYGLIIAFFIFF